MLHVTLCDLSPFNTEPNCVFAMFSAPVQWILLNIRAEQKIRTRWWLSLLKTLHSHSDRITPINNNVLRNVTQATVSLVLPVAVHRWHYNQHHPYNNVQVCVLYLQQTVPCTGKMHILCLGRRYVHLIQRRRQLKAWLLLGFVYSKSCVNKSLINQSWFLFLRAFSYSIKWYTNKCTNDFYHIRTGLHVSTLEVHHQGSKRLEYQ